MWIVQLYSPCWQKRSMKKTPSSTTIGVHNLNVLDLSQLTWLVLDVMLAHPFSSIPPHFMTLFANVFHHHFAARDCQG